LELQVEQLSKTYAGSPGTRAMAPVAAMQEVSLTISPGMFGLLGPNGAGKSTLMNTIATLQAPDSGRIWFGDLDVLREPQKLRSQLGYLPQEFGVYPHTSGEAMLDYFAELKGLTHARERRRHVEELLELVNLKDAARRSADGYSGGMRQRWGIAQALIGRPRLVIVDEPTAGLDPAERHRFHNILSEIGEETVVLLSTHIVEDVATLCSRMAVMNAGRIVALGTPGDLIAALRGRLWETRVTKVERRAVPGRLGPDARVLSSRLSGGHVALVIHAPERPDASFQPREPDLEDVYFFHVPQAAD
jgi:ABC-type multidrug transport system ATPase subunit